jgi:hypothetical protein
LNEEIFAVSEALAQAFSSSKPNPTQLRDHAYAIDDRKNYLINKVRLCITNNPTVHKLSVNQQASIMTNDYSIDSGHRRRTSFSPPQRDRSREK